MTKQASPPDHLTASTAEWFQGIIDEFELESHHIKLLTIAAESWDRYVQAREDIAAHGTVYYDRFEAPRLRPEVRVEREARIDFMRALRELDLDVEPPAEPTRPPRLRSNRV